MVRSLSLASDVLSLKDSLNLLPEQEQYLLDKAIEFCDGDELAGNALLNEFFESLSESDSDEIRHIPTVERNDLALRPGGGLTRFLRTFAERKKAEQESNVQEFPLEAITRFPISQPLRRVLNEKCIEMFPEDDKRADQFLALFLVSPEAQSAGLEIPSVLRKGRVERTAQHLRQEEALYLKAFYDFCKRQSAEALQSVESGSGRIQKTVQYVGAGVAAVLLAAGAVKGVKSYQASQEAPYKMLEQVEMNPEIHPEVLSQLDTVLKLSRSYSDFRDPGSADFSAMEAGRLKDNEAFWASVKDLCDMLGVSTQERDSLEGGRSSYDANVAQLQLVVSEYLGKNPDSLGKRGFMGPKTQALLEELRDHLQQ